jgi:protein-tyrosine-phosphatase
MEGGSRPGAPGRQYHVLFLCTGNSARSIMGEVLANYHGLGKLKGFSAGSQPKGQLHPLTAKFLMDLGYDLTGARSKGWHEFAGAGAPSMDFVFTVCDAAAGEACPVWPGRPITAHWSLPDPANAPGTEEEKLQVVRQVYRTLRHRIELFASLPLDMLDADAVREKAEELGRVLPGWGGAS